MPIHTDATLLQMALIGYDADTPEDPREDRRTPSSTEWPVQTCQFSDDRSPG